MRGTYGYLFAAAGAWAAACDFGLDTNGFSGGPLDAGTAGGDAADGSVSDAGDGGETSDAGESGIACGGGTLCPHGNGSVCCGNPARGTTACSTSPPCVPDGGLPYACAEASDCASLGPTYICCGKLDATSSAFAVTYCTKGCTGRTLCRGVGDATSCSAALSCLPDTKHFPGFFFSCQ
jgi:hypothetical protein